MLGTPVWPETTCPRRICPKWQPARFWGTVANSPTTFFLGSLNCLGPALGCSLCLASLGPWLQHKGAIFGGSSLTPFSFSHISPPPIQHRWHPPLLPDPPQTPHSESATLWTCRFSRRPGSWPQVTGPWCPGTGRRWLRGHRWIWLQKLGEAKSLSL